MEILLQHTASSNLNVHAWLAISAFDAKKVAALRFVLTCRTVLSTKQQQWTTKHSGILQSAGPTSHAHFKSALRSAHLECPSTSDDLQRHHQPWNAHLKGCKPRSGTRSSLSRFIGLVSLVSLWAPFSSSTSWQCLYQLELCGQMSLKYENRLLSAFIRIIDGRISIQGYIQ